MPRSAPPPARSHPVSPSRTVLAVRAVAADADAPLRGLAVDEIAAPPDRPGWVRVRVRAAALNHHDLWTLRGRVRPAGGLPAVLGMDAAGVDEDGNDVVVHAVLGDPERGGGDETLDPDRTFLPDAGHGTLCAEIVVPRRNLVPKPPELSFVEAACLPTAWLTAYRMLFTRARARAGDRLLVQGAGGGVATAALFLGRAAGLHVDVVSRSPDRAERARELGAHRVYLTGERLPGTADIVLDTVGAATWKVSLAAARPGGTVVLCGATSGFDVPTNLARLFSRQLTVAGSTMGTRAELAALLRMLRATGVRPVVHGVRPLAEAARQFAALAGGEVFGKLVVVP